MPTTGGEDVQTGLGGRVGQDEWRGGRERLLENSPGGHVSILSSVFFLRLCLFSVAFWEMEVIRG